MRPYQSIFKECVIVSGTFSNKLILAKNRDRAYNPNLYVIHEYKNGIELCYILDDDTGWAEGMNEFGIGIINTALIVGRDEKEHKIAAKTGHKSKDGNTVLEALLQKTPEAVVHSLINNKESPLKGHTIVSSPSKSFRIEMTSRHESIVKEINQKEIIVRTNHGFEYSDAGYTDGASYYSSKVRKTDVEDYLTNSDTPKEVLEKMRKQKYSKKSNLNYFRNTDHMSTTGQILMDLSNLKFYYHPVKNKSNFHGVVKDIPDTADPKISIEIVE